MLMFDYFLTCFLLTTSFIPSSPTTSTFSPGLILSSVDSAVHSSPLIFTRPSVFLGLIILATLPVVPIMVDSPTCPIRPSVLVPIMNITMENIVNSTKIVSNPYICMLMPISGSPHRQIAYMATIMRPLLIIDSTSLATKSFLLPIC